jgi:hypothetical protein
MPRRVLQDRVKSSDDGISHPKSGVSSSGDESTRDRFFNPFRTALSDDAASIVWDISKQVEAAESRLRRRKERDRETHKRAIEAVITDVLHRHWTAPNQWVAVRMSNRALSRKSRYRSAVLSEPLRPLLSLLERLGWIQVVRGRRDETTRRATTMRAARRLIDQARGLGLKDLGTDPSEEVIILKPAKVAGRDEAYLHPDLDVFSGRDYLNYEDNATTRRYRDEMRRINAWLVKAEIDYYDDAEAGIDISQRRLRRIFNGSFEQGGRLYDGFWQQMSKEAREDLFVDASRTVEVDYSQMAIRTVYAMARVPYVGQDAYIIPGYKRYRKGIKKLVSAMLYASKRLTQFPRGVREMLPKDADLSTLLADIERTHAPIKDYFYRGVGLNAMFLESEVMVAVLLRLMKHDVVALPIHDAVLVPKRHLDITTHVMMEVFKQHLGVEPLLTVGE